MADYENLFIQGKNVEKNTGVYNEIARLHV